MPDLLCVQFAKRGHWKSQSGLGLGPLQGVTAHANTEAASLRVAAMSLSISTVRNETHVRGTIHNPITFQKYRYSHFIFYHLSYNSHF